MKKVGSKKVLRGLLWGGVVFVAILLVIKGFAGTITIGSYAAASALGLSLFFYEVFFQERYSQRMGEIVRRILKID